MKSVILVLGIGIALSASTARADIFSVSYEQPAVFATSESLVYGGVETFNELSPGVQSFQSSYGTAGFITGSYAGVEIDPNGQLGGVGSSGNYANIAYGNSYAINLSTTEAKGINYFGAFMTAVDPGNQIDFYKGSTLVGSYVLTDTIPASIANNPDYLVNTSFYNNHEGQPFVFMNFVDTSGTFDKVVFGEPAALQYGGSFESDNRTVGYVASAVPEPATWAMMLLGLGTIGFAARRRRHVSVAYA